MRADHLYAIEGRARVQTSISGQIDILAIESDARGRQAWVFDAVKDQPKSVTGDARATTELASIFLVGVFRTCQPLGVSGETSD